MGECINLRRTVTKKELPVLNPNFPSDYSGMYSNGTATFKVEIAEHGSPANYTYKWYWDGSVLSWATTDTCTISLNHGESVHTLYCEVTNKAGTVRSRTATITLSNTYLYHWGKTFDSVTGGWVGNKALPASETSYKLAGWSNESDGLYSYLDTTSGKGLDIFIVTKNKIDLTHYSKIEFVVREVSFTQSEYELRMGASSANSATFNNMTAYLGTRSVGTYNVDIRGVNGSYYVGALAWHYGSGEAKFKIESIRLIV